MRLALCRLEAVAPLAVRRRTCRGRSSAGCPSARSASTPPRPRRHDARCTAGRPRLRAERWHVLLGTAPCTLLCCTARSETASTTHRTAHPPPAAHSPPRSRTVLRAHEIGQRVHASAARIRRHPRDVVPRATATRCTMTGSNRRPDGPTTRRRRGRPTRCPTRTGAPTLESPAHFDAAGLVHAVASPEHHRLVERATAGPPSPSPHVPRSVVRRMLRRVAVQGHVVQDERRATCWERALVQL